jgi:hypothetical protein
MNTMITVLEISGQIILSILAFWMIWIGYVHNKKAPPFSLKETSFREITESSTNARSLIIGIGLLIILIAKLYSCGPICSI